MGFKVDLSSDESIPLPQIPVYLTAVDMMASLALRDQRSTWDTRRWTLATYNVWFLLTAQYQSSKSRLQSRFAVWGLEYGIFSMTFWHKVQRTNMRLHWQDQFVGNITIKNRLDPSPIGRPPAQSSVPGLIFPAKASKVQLLGSLTFSSNLGEICQVFYDYDGTDIDSADFFTALISVMRICADEGADSRAPSIQLSLWNNCVFSMASETDKYGNSLLRYRHVVSALRTLAFQVVENNIFAEMTIVINANGIKVAKGRLSKKTPTSISK